MRWATAAIAVVVLLVAGTKACSRDEPDPVDDVIAVTYGFDACALFTIEQVKSFVGTEVDAAEKIPAASDDPDTAAQGGCTYTSTLVEETTRMRFFVTRVSDWQAAKAEVEGDTRFLAGLGEWAGWSTNDTFVSVAAFTRSLGVVVACDVPLWTQDAPRTTTEREAFEVEAAAQRDRCNVPVIQRLLARLI